MSMGTLTFGSLARLNDYRNTLTSTAQTGQTKGAPISPISPLIPTGTLDVRTEQALQWSGLKPASTKNEAAFSSFSNSPGAAAYPSDAPPLDFAYSFASIKGILAYRDALASRSADVPNFPPEETLDENR